MPFLDQGGNVKGRDCIDINAISLCEVLYKAYPEYISMSFQQSLQFLPQQECTISSLTHLLDDNGQR